MAGTRPLFIRELGQRSGHRTATPEPRRNLFGTGCRKLFGSATALPICSDALSIMGVRQWRDLRMMIAEYLLISPSTTTACILHGLPNVVMASQLQVSFMKNSFKIRRVRACVRAGANRAPPPGSPEPHTSLHGF